MQTKNVHTENVGVAFTNIPCAHLKYRFQSDPDAKLRFKNDFMVTGVQTRFQTMGNTIVTSFSAGE